jgi:hypothetical protein
MRSAIRAVLALVGGFGLSFLALGVLWIGVGWMYQLLMTIPFLLLAFAITRSGDAGDRLSWLIVLGAAPIGWLLTLFRDKNDSHLMSLLVVCAWLAGTLAGMALGAKRRPRSGLAS